MMHEQLYINGVLMDTDGELDITLVFKSNLFNDVDKIETNSSKTISLPRTANNMMAVGFAGMAGAESAFPYTTHEASYYRNGVQIVDGKALLLAIRDKIEISILWGAYKQIEGLLKSKMKLNELKSDAQLEYARLNRVCLYENKGDGFFYAGYNPNKGTSEEDWLSILTFGGDGTLNQREEYHTRYYRSKANELFWGAPTATVRWLLHNIEREFGVQIKFPTSTNDFIDNIAVPLVNNIGSDERPVVYGQLGKSIPESGKMDMQMFYVGKQFALGFRDGEANHTNANEIVVQQDCDVDIEVIIRGKFKDTKAGYTPKDIVLSTPFLYINDEKFAIGGEIDDNGEPQPTHTFYYSDSDIDADGYVEYTVKGKVQRSISSEDVLSIRYEDTWYDNGTGDILGGEISIIRKSIENVEEHLMYPIARNLPDITIVDFLKALFFLSGVFVKQLGEDGVIELCENNKLKDFGFGQDWTRNLISIDETVFEDGEMAQKNHYKWEEDGSVKGNYDYTLAIDNKILKEERDAYKLPFAAADGDSIPLNEFDDDATYFDQPNFADVSPKLMTMYPKKYTTEYPEYEEYIHLRFDIDLANIIKTKHPLIANPNRFLQIKATVRMTDLDLLNFDETKPIYLAQTGAYYAVKELQANNKGNATATLIKI